MKKSFFVGFLATLGLSEYTTTSTHTSTSTVVVNNPVYPSVTASQALNAISSSTSSQSTQSTIDGVISSARASTVYQARSIDSLFLSLPTLAQIDRLILNADTVALLKTVQTGILV